MMTSYNESYSSNDLIEPIDYHNQLLLIHNNLLTILFNSTINCYNMMAFIEKTNNIRNNIISSDSIGSDIIVKYNKTQIFEFSIISDLDLSNIKSSHNNFNFKIRSSYVIYTNKFVEKIGSLVLSIINNHNMIRNIFHTIKPIIIADMIYLNKNVQNEIFIKIYFNIFELNINNEKIEYYNIEDLSSNKSLSKYKKLNFKKLISSIFC